MFTPNNNLNDCESEKHQVNSREIRDIDSEFIINSRKRFLINSESRNTKLIREDSEFVVTSRKKIVNSL